ncbi:acetyltransferase [Rhodococcus sp. MEB064]|nr:acetyltransferase [Rhodococcus sp. MEB064]
MTVDAGVGDSGIQFMSITQDDPLAAPLLQDLAREYASRYGRSPDELREELESYPGNEFAAPHGALIVAVLGGVPIAGGAYRRFDCRTAELKRIWTARAYRGKGFGRLVVSELERSARDRGYRRIYLTTGWNQPEAVALYLAAGYRPLYDQGLPSESVGIHPFEKAIAA